MNFKLIMRQIILKYYYYYFFDETNFESMSISIKYKSIDISFSELFKTQNMTNVKSDFRMSTIKLLKFLLNFLLERDLA